MISTPRTPHVLEHRVEREQVAVNVRQRGDFHEDEGPYFARHFLDDPADGYQGTLVGSGADLFRAIRGPDAEVDAAALDPQDLGMA